MEIISCVDEIIELFFTAKQPINERSYITHIDIDHNMLQ